MPEFPEIKTLEQIANLRYVQQIPNPTIPGALFKRLLDAAEELVKLKTATRNARDAGRNEGWWFSQNGDSPGGVLLFYDPAKPDHAIDKDGREYVRDETGWHAASASCRNDEQEVTMGSLEGHRIHSSCDVHDGRRSFGDRVHSGVRREPRP